MPPGQIVVPAPGPIPTAPFLYKNQFLDQTQNYLLNLSITLKMRCILLPHVKGTERIKLKFYLLRNWITGC